MIDIGSRYESVTLPLVCLHRCCPYGCETQRDCFVWGSAEERAPGSGARRRAGCVRLSTSDQGCVFSVVPAEGFPRATFFLQVLFSEPTACDSLPSCVSWFPPLAGFTSSSKLTLLPHSLAHCPPCLLSEWHHYPLSCPCQEPQLCPVPQIQLSMSPFLRLYVALRSVCSIRPSLGVGLVANSSQAPLIAASPPPHHKPCLLSPVRGILLNP